ncbi:hypothetical protein [Thermocoleostomius sinensis]|jgi:hypothetical protein|uniref:Uncharacterized protein n=1 Tax=Thermocoleostomius sinensis A174 TaxID=2016057 RepID=A0A9E8ZGL4_9CYAN|nr:hypothetical protein [Thermocoleostomius sinensis]WAL61407.1 hypothetical protein OXH18_05290 [Thermocoleostomius sinensis A174]
MQDKHKVTLYLPPELHRQLKIRSAVELEPMSTLAERAIVFYLEHPDLVDEVEVAHGQTHQLYHCPECASSLVIRQGELVSVSEPPSLLSEDDVTDMSNQSLESDQKGEELVSLLG